jgi:hypothetical protein
VKKAASNLALALVSVAVALLAAEAVVRLFLPQQLILVRPDIWRPDDKTGWRRCGNIDTRVNWGEGSVRLVTDADGFRVDGPEDRARGGADLSVLMVGDSFLEALAVENAATIPRLVADSLAAREGVAVRVDNSSAGGWNPNHYRLEVERALSTRAYDVGVVFFYVANDVVDESLDSIPPRAPTIRHPFRFPRRLEWRELVSSVLYPINDALETRSHLFILLRKGSTDLRARLGLTPFYFPPVFLEGEAGSAMWDVTASIFAGIEQEFAARSTPVFFVLIPSVHQVDDAILESYLRWFDIDRSAIDLEQPNRELAARFAAAGLDLVDLTAHLREIEKKGRPDVRDRRSAFQRERAPRLRGASDPRDRRPPGSVAGESGSARRSARYTPITRWPSWFQ